MIDEIRASFNRRFHPSPCARLLAQLEHARGTAIGIRVADAPVLPSLLLERKAVPEAAGNGKRGGRAISAAFFPGERSSGEVHIKLPLR